jgi:hypothetical protein
MNLHRGQVLGAIRADLQPEQISTLTWGIWESCRSWLPSEANRMQALVHPDIVLDLFRRALTPIERLEHVELDDAAIPDADQLDDSAFQGAKPEDLEQGFGEAEPEDLDQKARESKAQNLLRSFKGPL